MKSWGAWLSGALEANGSQSAMTRRSALDRSTRQPVDLIPLAGTNKRTDRKWDLEHRGYSYYIPAHLREKARDIRTAVLGLSRMHLASTSNVATALISFSLAHVRQGRLRLEGHPDASRQKMTLQWEEVTDGKPQMIQPRKSTKSAHAATQEIYLNYRWGQAIHEQIKGLAGTVLSKGDVVVALLEYALAAHKSGRLRLKEETVIVSQKVSAKW
jgi:hypothetical protein